MAEAQRWPNSQNILNAAAATGTGTPINVRDFKNIMLSLATSGSATLTVKIQGTVLDTTTAPDFSSSASITNRWDYVACFNLIDPTTVIAGGTGVSASGTDIVRNLLVNTDALVWLCVTVTAYTGGAVTVDSISFNNQ